MLIFLLLLQFLSLALTTERKDEYRIVKTRLGAIRGKRVDSYGGQSGFAFLGIPEGRPPLGELRFREALDPFPWPGVLDAFQYRNACLSDPKMTFKVKEGNKEGPVSEDCLYINVFSSRTCLDKGGCAVMAVFHGGVLKFESPVIYRMDTIVNNFANDERNIVLVTIPYRLAVNGLFHLTAEFKTSLDANILIKDCIFGLKWIQREIAAFGGDPKRVTIYGHSAGGMITNLLASLPATEDLFHQLVAQSGPPTQILDYTPTANIYASRAVAEMVGCAEKGEEYKNKDTVEKIIACLRGIPQEDLLNGHIDLNFRVEEVSSPWIDGPNGILPYGREKLMKNVRMIPSLIGTVTAEFRDSRFVVDSTGKVNLTRLTELCSQFAYAKGYHEPEKFTRECIKYYERDNVTQFFDDDVGFYVGTGENANSFTKAGANVFVYSYDYWGAGPLFNKYSGERYLGPSHSEDYVYILGLHRNDSLMKEKDFEIERIYSGIVANFINYGNPGYRGYEWKPWDPKKRNYFVIDFDKNFRMPGERDGYYSEANAFWNEYLPKKVGGFTVIDKFPPRHDIVIFSDVINYMLANWTGKSHHHDKTYNASMDAYRLWTDFLAEERKAFLKKNFKLKSGEIPAADLRVPTPMVEELQPKKGFSWLTFSLAVAVVFLAGYIAIVKFLEYRKRKDYQAIVQ